MNLRTSRVTISSQRGVVAILTAVSMVTLIAMAGLALDMGHVYLNKTRLQNALDAAALAAAKTLDNTGDPVVAEADALAMFTLNANGAGNGELGAALAAGDITLVTEFSDTLIPFVPGGASPAYVRVSVDDYTLDSFLIQVLGINDKTVKASAVSGPSPTLVAEACDIAPMMVCGDPTGNADTSDGDFFGYEFNELQVLKAGPPGGETPPGPGNFQLVRYGDGQGAKEIREGMAGDYEGCARSGDTVTTETGSNNGPVSFGLNTRFGDYGGPMNGTEIDYPPDVNVSEVIPPLAAEFNDLTGKWDILNATTQTGITAAGITAWDYAFYQMNMTNSSYNPPPPDGSGAYNRRMLTVPMGDCGADPACTGACDIPLLGFGCFFLLQKVNIGEDPEVYGQFVDGCGAYGPPGPDPGSGPGPYIIQLYEDVGSLDS